MTTAHLRRLSALCCAIGLSFAAVSCGGAGGGGGSGGMVLVSFNLPNIAGVALNTPLIYQFSEDVDPISVTPDTLQVVGSPSFTFERIVVDGNLVAELPFIPNFKDYSDAGMAPGTQYTVSLPVFPAVDTIRSTTGRPLTISESFTFVTIPSFTFIECRRPLLHTPGPLSAPPGHGDEDGCVQNPDNELWSSTFQFGTDPSARLLCIKNEGSPHVLPFASIPFFDQRNIGTLSAVQPGLVDMPAIRTRFNEPLDPLQVANWNPTSKRGLTLQLWRVGDSDANPLPPVQIQTNEPVVVQDLIQTETIMVAIGPQLQGTYLVNVLGLRDLKSNPLTVTDAPNPIPGGYGPIDAAITGLVPPGYRMYFRTQELPATPGSFTESFGNNFNEGISGLYTQTTVPNSIDTAIPGSPALGATGLTLTQATPGQATDANWNGAYKFLGKTTSANNALGDGSGLLKAVYAPYLGNGEDGALNVVGAVTISTDAGDFNSDGVYEFTSINVAAGGFLQFTGTRPATLLCRGACTISGTVRSNGADGGFGIDTSNTARYTHASAIRSTGTGGTAGAGGGRGGVGGPALVLPNTALAESGAEATNVFFETSGVSSVGRFGANGDGTNEGGGGGANGSSGTGGTNAGLNGAAFGTSDFVRVLAAFVPDRIFQPNAGATGGAGGGGGGVEDDNGASETGDGMITVDVGNPLHLVGDDGGGGGGGGGGAFWFIADTITVAGTAVLEANGGRGGNTYGPAEQVITMIPPVGMNPAQEFVSGVTNPAAPGTGEGGGGGGGAGGSMLLQARTSFAAAAGAVFRARGGVGGTTGGNLHDGGAGGDGRIGLMSFAASGESPAGSFSNAATFDIGAGTTATGAIWRPTVDLTSQGVSDWVNLVTPATTFSAPFFDDNFDTLVTSFGLTRSLAGDFDAFLEFQGTDSIGAPTAATAWSPAFSSIDNKLFVRYRWRFFARKDYPQLTTPMPTVFDFTLPFTK